MELIAWWFLIGVLHVSFRFLLDSRRLAQNREDAASRLYVDIGLRVSPEAAMLMQIMVGIVLWPVGVVSLLARLFR